MKTNAQNEQRGILWLTFPDQRPPVRPQFDTVARHFHVTLCFGVTEAAFAEYIGREVRVEFLYNCYNDRIQACQVAIHDDEVGDLCRNDYPHCTISMADGVRPVESNEMLAGDPEVHFVRFIVWATVEWVPFPSNN